VGRRTWRAAYYTPTATDKAPVVEAALGKAPDDTGPVAAEAVVPDMALDTAPAAAAAPGTAVVAVAPGTAFDTAPVAAAVAAAVPDMAPDKEIEVVALETELVVAAVACLQTVAANLHPQRNRRKDKMVCPPQHLYHNFYKMP